MITAQVDTMMPTGRYVPVHVVQNEQDALVCEAWCAARRGQRLGLDAETNAEIPQDPAFRLRTVQISDGWEAWYIPVGMIPFYRLSDIINCGVQWVAHFAGLAEIPFLHNGFRGQDVNWRMTDGWGEHPVIVDNAVLLAHYDPRVLPPRAKVAPGIVRPKGLKDTVERELSPALQLIEQQLHGLWHEWAPKGQRTPKAMARWGFANTPLDHPVFIAYAALDAIMLARLWAKEYSEIQRRGIVDIVESDLLVQWDIQCADAVRGLPVDEPYARWLDNELGRVVEQHAAVLARHGVPPSAQGPSVDTAFRATGIQMPSYDKYHLNDFLADDASHNYPAARELAENVLAVRRAGKFRSTYTKAMLAACTRDGRLHSQILACGTVTHRMSSSQPNIQNLPKKDTRIRAAFGNVPGWVFVSCDFAQGEPRTLAANSGDPNLVADVMSGDINTATAIAAFGAAFDPAQGKHAGTPSYLMRQGAKAGFLAVCYAVGIKKLASTMGLPIERAEEVRDAWKRRYASAFARGARQNQQAVITLANGRTIPLWDRYFVADGQLMVSNKPSRKAMNYETQGQQRDWLVLAWLRLRSLPGREWWRYLALFLHDEIILLVPEHLAAKAAIDLKRAMTFELGNGVTMECEATVDGATMMPQPREFNPAELSAMDGDDELMSG